MARTPEYQRAQRVVAQKNSERGVRPAVPFAPFKEMDTDVWTSFSGFLVCLEPTPNVGPNAWCLYRLTDSGEDYCGAFETREQAMATAERLHLEGKS